MRRGLMLFLMLVAAIALAVMATTPPGPLPANAPVDAFSAMRAMGDVEAIARAPHTGGSEENAKVRAYLLSRMQAMGMEVSSSQFQASDYATRRLNRWSGRNDPPMTLTNLIGIMPGIDRRLPAVLLMAHHDTVWGSPGAADDTAGVAATLEAVRALRASGQPRRDVIVLFTDGEELGLEGAKHFFSADPLREHVGAVINMEARGGGGRTTLFQTSHDNGEAVLLYKKAVRHPGASSLSAYVYSVLPNDTDLTPVVHGPWIGYNFAFIGRSGLYHSPKATPARLDKGALQDMGAQVLELSRALAARPDLPEKTRDAVFFDLFGMTTLVWPAWLGWGMLAIGLAGWLLAAQPLRGRVLAGGAARMIGLVAGSALLFWALNRLSLHPGPSNYYDRLASIPRLEAFVLLAGLASFLAVMGTWKADNQQLAGATLPWLLLGLAGQALAPTAAYIIVVPVALAGLVLAARRWLPDLLSLPLAAILGAGVLGYMIALGHQLMQGVGPTMAFAAAIPLGLGAMAVLPLWTGLPRGKVAVWTLALLAGAVAVAFWVRLDAPADTIAAYADTKH